MRHEKEENEILRSTIADLIKSEIPDRFYKDLERQIYKLTREFIKMRDIGHLDSFSMNLTISGDIIPYIEVLINQIKENPVINLIYENSDISIVNTMVKGFVEDLNDGDDTITLKGDVMMDQILQPLEIPDEKFVENRDGRKRSVRVTGKYDDDLNKVVFVNNTNMKIIDVTYKFTIFYTHMPIAS
jgi:hypothetical protein